MIDVYFWPTGNGKKITIMLEEIALPYRIIPVNINKGDQLTPEYDALNPNNKMPVIVDPDAKDGPMVIFESGAILQYLAEKSGKLLPSIRVPLCFKHAPDAIGHCLSVAAAIDANDSLRLRRRQFAIAFQYPFEKDAALVIHSRVGCLLISVA